MQKENFFVDNEIYELATLWVLRAIFYEEKKSF